MVLARIADRGGEPGAAAQTAGYPADHPEAAAAAAREGGGGGRVQGRGACGARGAAWGADRCTHWPPPLFAVQLVVQVGARECMERFSWRSLLVSVSFWQFVAVSGSFRQ